MIKISTCKERLNYLFDHSNKNDTAIAEELDVSKQTISAWRKGTRSPKKPMIDKIASHYKVDVVWLMGYEDDNPWTENFMRTLTDIVENANEADLQAMDLDRAKIQEIIEKKAPLTFEVACDIVDKLGESFDFMLGRETEQAIYSADEKDGEPIKEAISLMLQLSEHKRIQAVDYLRYLATLSENH